MLFLLYYLIEKYFKGNIRLILVIEVWRIGIYLFINLVVGMFLSFISVDLLINFLFRIGFNLYEFSL